MRRNFDDDDDEKEPEPTWPAIRDLFANLIIKAKDWPDAELTAEPRDMIACFKQAYPEVIITMEDMRLALYDLGVPFERNEFNSKFYYLARYK
jgi:hypothetical protein